MGISSATCAQYIAVNMTTAVIQNKMCSRVMRSCCAGFYWLIGSEEPYGISGVYSEITPIFIQERENDDGVGNGFECIEERWIG